MTFSIDQYTGTGAQTTFTVHFPFISRDHVFVSVAGNPVTPVWLNDGLILLSPAPANGALVDIRRNSHQSGPLVDFQDAEVLTEVLIDLANTQAIYIAQEAFDASDVALVSGAVAASAAAAAASAAAAGTSATNAATSASGASTSATNAAASAVAAAASATAAAGSATSAASSASSAAATLANALVKTNNLSDVSNVATSRTNLGLGTAAVVALTSLLQVSNNLSEVTPATARTNLGLGSIATHPTTDYVSTAGDTMTGVLTFSDAESGGVAVFNKIKNTTAANANGSRWQWQAGHVTTKDYLALMPLDDTDTGTTAVFRIWRTGTTIGQVEWRNGARCTFGGVTDDGVTSLQADTVLISTSLKLAAISCDATGTNIDKAASFSFQTELDDGNSGTTKTIAFNVSNYHKVLMTGNCTFTFTAPSGPTVCHLKLTQDGTGSRTMTLPAGKWPARYQAADKLLSTAINKIDLLVAKWDGAAWYYSLEKDWA